MDTHLHWIIWVYRVKLDNGDYQDTTTLDFIANDYKEAIKRAELIFPLSFKGGVKSGAGYRVTQVVEHLGLTCR